MKLLPRVIWWRVYRWRHQRRVARRAMTAAFLAAILVATACTPRQVQNAGFELGVALTWEEAQALANPDCLPDYDSPVRVECGIRDSWSHYRLDELGISLDRWAKVAWCESNHRPEVTNSTSGALGLFQHLPRYWPDRLARSGWEGHGEWDDGRINAFVSAFHAHEVGSLQPWQPSKHCWQHTP